jgi:hypothetical protein
VGPVGRWIVAGLVTLAAFAVFTWVSGIFLFTRLLPSPDTRWPAAFTIGAAAAAFAGVWGQWWATQSGANRIAGLSLAQIADGLADPMSKMFFNMLAVFAEFEADLLKMRTREGMAVARSRGRLKGRQPKLTPRQQAELVRMHGTGEYTIADLMEVFSVGRATVYRVLGRVAAPAGQGS